MTNLSPVFRSAAAAPPVRPPQPPQDGPRRPAFGIAYFFSDTSECGDPNPVFDELRRRIFGDGGAQAAQVITASSRNETPEPPVPQGQPQPPQEAEPSPAPAGAPPGSEPPAGGTVAAGDGEEPKRQPLPRGEAERRALLFLSEHPEEDYTPGAIAKAIDARGMRDAMARLWARGQVEKTCEHPIKYRAAAKPPAQAAG